ncbi:SCP2 sterol-binding domain-containing protein [Micromonospora sp. WMMD1102]|uniref:SCP2 sterol-binding domain-containing protein n=1 Tax=Micromonospora sp. WMMD1102 TaxID=3016105 RepID=UPI0024155380|nr:SCP2 sterol-binding domain-containing protein [Micromonospora sp. WMMD1102]MDG4791743.1 SCP2 sterol-binding domain-containing protein [Micromonospora sp. WMMD1102]
MDEFFETLGRQRHPLLRKVDAMVRFDLVSAERTDHRTVKMRDGSVVVTWDRGAADCIVRTDRSILGRVVAGDETLIAPLLRGVLTAEGDLEVFFLAGRLFSGRGAPSGVAPDDESPSR